MTGKSQPPRRDPKRRRPLPTPPGGKPPQQPPRRPAAADEPTVPRGSGSSRGSTGSRPAVRSKAESVEPTTGSARRRQSLPTRSRLELSSGGGSDDDASRHTEHATAVETSAWEQQQPVELSGDVTRVRMQPTLVRYQLGDELGRGGMGTVHTALDPAIRREVAIKVLRAADDASERQAFVDEAQITGQLEHPNIVPVHELGTDERGRPFLAMKRIEGVDFRHVLEEAHDAAADDAEWFSTLRELLEIFGKVCDAVGYAHARGVIHRDLKPANVMVGPFGEVLVVDWGLAKPLADETRIQPVRTDRREQGIDTTHVGELFGTPQFMPPEQADGRAAEMDQRGDIYSLGAILYQILLGEPPVRGKNVDQVLEKVIAGKIVPPSQRSRARAVPRELDAACMKALAYDPEDRYQSVAEFKADIDAFAAGRALAAADYSLWQLLGKWAKRNKAAVVGGLSTAAALLIGLVAVVWVIANAEVERLQTAQQAREEAAAEERDKAIAEANDFYESYQRRKLDAEAVEFNPASPAPWTQAWLATALALGQAIQSHPEPPQPWRAALAEHCASIQQRAESVGDWGLAEHIAESALAWGAIDETTWHARQGAVAEAKQTAERMDLERLVAVLEAIDQAEARFDEQGNRLGRQPMHDEVAERARRVAGAVRDRAATTTAIVLAALQGDVQTLQKLGIGPEQTQVETQLRRMLLIELLGRLGDTTTQVNGETAPQRIATELTAEYDWLREQEMNAWVRTAARLEASRPGSVQSFEPQDTQWHGRLGLSLRTAAALQRFVAGDHTLPETPPGEMDSEAFAASISEIAEWSASAARSGSAYTGNLLAIHERESLEPIAEHLGRRGTSKLGYRQREFIIQQLGLYGDNRPTTPGAEPPSTVLLSSLKEIPDAALNDDAAFDPRRLAIALIQSLSRLGGPDPQLLLDQKRWAAGEHSIVWRRTSLAFSLLPELDSAAVPQTAQQFQHRGNARIARGDHAGALADIDRAIALEPTNSRLFNSRGMVRDRLGDLDGAIADFDRAIELDPHNIHAYNNRGLARKDKGDFAEAIDDFDRAIEIDPSFTLAISNRGLARIDTGDLEGALADFDRVIEHNPSDAHTLATRGGVHANVGDYAAAIADYNRAIRIDPSLAAAFHNRALAWSNKGDLNSAIADFDRAIQLNPNFAEAFQNRGDTRLDIGDIDGAFADYDNAIQLNPRLAEPFVSRGNAWRAIGEFRRAIADYDHAIELEPDLAEAYNNRGTTHSAMGNLDEAIADYNRAIEINPTFSQAYVNRANARRAKGELEEALADFDRAVELAPEDAIAHYNRGLARADHGDLDGAIADYSRAIELEPNFAQAYHFRGSARAAQGNLDEAIADNDRAIEVDPYYGNAYIGRGSVRRSKGDLDGALADFERAIEINRQDWRAWANHGLVLSQQGRNAQAITSLQEAYRHCNVPAWRQQIADWLQQLGGRVPE